MIRTFQQSDGYLSHYRVWGPDRGRDVIVMLHGGISHSGWQSPLGEAIMAADPYMTFLAVDRRGSGANADRGHIPDSERVLIDLAEFIHSLISDFDRVHLAGWYFGAQVATAAASRLTGESLLSSLVMISPGFFINKRYSHFDERYSDLMRFSVESAEVYIKVPSKPVYFTPLTEWQSFIEDDELKLVKVTAGTVEAWGELARLGEDGLARLGELPVLAIFGRWDRLVDNARVRRLINAAVPSARIEEFDTGHAVQFEQAERLAQLLTSFAGKI